MAVAAGAALGLSPVRMLRWDPASLGLGAACALPAVAFSLFLFLGPWRPQGGDLLSSELRAAVLEPDGGQGEEPPPPFPASLFPEHVRGACNDLRRQYTLSNPGLAMGPVGELAVILVGDLAGESLRAVGLSFGRGWLQDRLLEGGADVRTLRRGALAALRVGDFSAARGLVAAARRRLGVGPGQTGEDRLLETLCELCGPLDRALPGRESPPVATSGVGRVRSLLRYLADDSDGEEEADAACEASTDFGTALQGLTALLNESACGIQADPGCGSGDQNSAWNGHRGICADRSVCRSDHAYNRHRSRISAGSCQPREQNVSAGESAPNHP